MSELEERIETLLAFAERWHYPRMLVTPDAIRPGEEHWRGFLAHRCAEDIERAMQRMRQWQARAEEEAS